MNGGYEKEEKREVVDIKILNKQIEELVAREKVLRDKIEQIIAEIEGDDYEKT